MGGKRILLLVGLGLCLMLAGCQNTAVVEQSAPPPSAQNSAAPSQAVYTQADAYEAFRQWTVGQGIETQTATGYVRAEDGFAGLRAVVTYTDTNNNTECNLAYVYEDGICCPIGVASNQSEDQRDFVLADGGDLTYLGEGKVSLEVEEVATGDRYRYTVQCGQEGPDTDFTVESEAISRSEG